MKKTILVAMLTLVTAACGTLNNDLSQTGNSYSERGHFVVIDKSIPGYIYVGTALSKVEYDEAYWTIMRSDSTNTSSSWAYAEGYKDSAFKWTERQNYNYFEPKK